MGAQAALKVLRSACAANPDLARRFANEARVQASINHVNVARIFDLFALPDGRPCIVMEYLDGLTLEERAEDGALEVGDALRILLQVCDGLAVAHAAGVVHRDVKAENVLLVRGADGAETVKILDFGIAQLRAGEPAATLAGMILGTPYYMSPEQAMGEAVDARADVYAVGVLAFRLLSGKVPFDGHTVTEVMFKHVRETAPRLEIVPPLLAAAVARALSKRREERPANAGELGRELRACLGATPPLTSLTPATKRSAARRAALG